MANNIEDIKEVKEFVLEKADILLLRETNYVPTGKNKYNEKTSKDPKYKTVDKLEVYSCDAGCKNCHCATY